jgi:4-amino-4-deoxy-L-arabinose transferase-like glycosyltransferase|tara:strand:+ start:13730 stop:15256 length:1527 start_codon:yes stop_codon:yes gene_type:complete
MNLIKKFKKQEKYTRYSILIIILFSVIVLALTSIHHVSGDGCWYVPVGKFMAENQNFPLFEPLGRDEPFWSPPLYHVLVAIVYGIFGAVNNSLGNFAVKFVSPIFGILSLIFTFLVVKKLVNSKIAFYSILFLAFIPIFIGYSVLSYVESTLIFFVILSVYFLINDKIILAGIAAGLSILAKYNGVFIIPVLLYIVYKKYSKKQFYKNGLIIAILPLIVASPWLIRNWILLGNPIWPFLNFIFNGYESMSYGSLNFSNLFHYGLLLFTYLGIFGVPDGNFHLFSTFKLPYSEVLLPIWLVGTFIFIIPLIVGFFNKSQKNKNIKNNLRTLIIGALAIWIISYLILFLLYVPNVGWAVSRIILPAFPALAVFWAFGYEKLNNSKLSKLFVILITLIIAGFIFTEFVKFGFAANQWNFYKEDFDWVKSNTPQKSIFLVSGQCIPYNIQRTSLFSTDENLNKADYIWVNQNFKLDKRSVLDESSLNSIESENYKEVYSNKKTGTLIYSTKP